VDTTFLTSLASIVFIDLLLAGDNALVIAMAVRHLAPEQRRAGILLGALAAVVLRVVLTFFVAQLLTLQFVKLAGGLLILWIAAKLFAAEGEVGGPGHAAGSLGQAVKVIVVADITMSLDNMLAVGGASHGSVGLLVLGLVLSIPFIMFTSGLLARVMDRHPWIVYAGAAVLGKVSADMIMTDPYIVEHLHPQALALHAAQLLLAAGVAVAGWLWTRGQRVQARST
jgi:YjbE family integral membrane protein